MWVTRVGTFMGKYYAYASLANRSCDRKSNCNCLTVGEGYLGHKRALVDPQVVGSHRAEPLPAGLNIRTSQIRAKQW